MSDVLDVLTVEEARGAINAQGENATGWLDLMTTAVSDALVRECGPIVSTSIVERHDGSTPVIVPAQWPILTVTSLIEYQLQNAVTLVEETPGTTPANGYLIDARRGVIMRRAGGLSFVFWYGQQNIVLTYTAGRAANTAAVPAVFKTAAQLTLAHLWDLKSGRGDPQFADSDAFTSNKFLFPWRVKEMLARYRRPTSIG